MHRSSSSLLRLLEHILVAQEEAALEVPSAGRWAARRAVPALPGDLVATLTMSEGSRFSELERLHQPPTRMTGTALPARWSARMRSVRIGPAG